MSEAAKQATDGVAALQVDDKNNDKKIKDDAKKKNQQKGQQEGKKKKAPPAPPRPWTEELQQDYDRIHSVGEECIGDLKALLVAKGRGVGEPGFNLYDGFEPSGRMHIAQGVFKAMNVNKCTSNGTNGTFVFWVADWFALMNDKMGGDLDKIKIVGQYLVQVWKAAGMDLTNVVFKWASDEITQQAHVYWPLMLDVARRFNVTRIKKCCQIMGRLEGTLTAAQVLYPLMQCTDVFFLKADICQLGVDQRKVNMLAREYCDFAKIKFKPIILSHHMLYGLKAGQEKMSKSDPDSAIFMEDAAVDVERKIRNAYCPTQAETVATTTANDDENDAGKESMHLKNDDDGLKNPCLDYIQHIIFSPPNATFTAGNGVTYDNYESVKTDFLNAKLSEEHLKAGLVTELNRLLEPVRQHFTHDKHAKQLLELVQQYKKESSSAPTKSAPRRLDLVGAKLVPASCHLVFAPLPIGAPTLQSAMDVLAQLKTAAGSGSRVLWLSDWSARVCNACLADAKAIVAYYKIFVASLHALDTGDIMQNTQVVYQSEAILTTDPSNYWISVINVGRHFSLQTVMDDMMDSEGVGKVIARLMQVADVAAVAPASVALSSRNSVADESSSNSINVEETIIREFLAEKLAGVVAVPSITQTSAPSIRLQAARESEKLQTENDEYFLMDDPKVHGKSKMKKAFCESGNTEFCPPIAIAQVFALQQQQSTSTLDIMRSDDNGGNKSYGTLEDLQADFGSGALHPGDLKAATTALMVETLNRLSKGLTADAAKEVKALKAFQKKANKAKK